METNTACLTFVLIMAIGFLVWILSLAKALRLGRATNRPDRMSLDPSTELHAESGELTVRGTPDAVSTALANALRQPGIAPFGTLFTVIEHSADRLVVKKTGPVLCNQPPGLYFSEAEFRFAPTGIDTVQVSYCLGYSRIVRVLKKTAMCIVWGAGLPTMLLVGSLMWFLVVRSENPTVRWQVFQTLHIAHALWPPFLVMWFYGVGRRRSRSFVENLITSVAS
ncbi:MAG: hypothetical protein FJ276_09950 [Planctomycetes bacterium]|nr:hypothetical protein [Planctomycetota bacterium]